MILSRVILHGWFLVYLQMIPRGTQRWSNENTMILASDTRWRNRIILANQNMPRRQRGIQTTIQKTSLMEMIYHRVKSYRNLVPGSVQSWATTTRKDRLVWAGTHWVCRHNVNIYHKVPRHTYKELVLHHVSRSTIPTTQRRRPATWRPWQTPHYYNQPQPVLVCWIPHPQHSVCRTWDNRWVRVSCRPRVVHAHWDRVRRPVPVHMVFTDLEAKDR